MVRVSRIHIVAFLARFLIAVATCVAAACSPSLNGGPPRIFSVEEEIRSVRNAYGPQLLAEYQSAVPAERRAIRNSAVLARMYAIDMAYGEFEKQLTSERQQVPFAAAIASIALSGTGTVVADAYAKTLLAAADTSLKGIGRAYSDQILIGKTIDLVQQTMRAERNRIRAQIVGKLSLPDLQYPLELALGDVENYYGAGTITGGMIGASALASAHLNESHALRENAAILEQYGADSSTALLRDYWRAGGADATARIRAWLDGQGMAVTITQFLNVAAYAGQRQALARHLGLAGISKSIR